MNNVSKHGKTFKIGALLLVVALISTVMISGTFAKYTSEYSGQDTALVAKWDVKPEAGQTGNLEAIAETGDSVTELDLFQHAHTKMLNSITTNGGIDYIIAPGVSGSFDIKVTNDSDVDAKMTFVLETVAGSANVPMVYTIEGDSPATEYTDLNLLAGALTMDNVTQGGTNKVVTVNWEWKFNDVNDVNDSINKADTLLGTASAGAGAGERTSYTLKITATATQVEPIITTP